MTLSHRSTLDPAFTEMIEMTSVAEAAETGVRTVHLIGDTDENEIIVTMMSVAEMSEGKDVKNEELDGKGESDENEENAGKNGSGTGMRR